MMILRNNKLLNRVFDLYLFPGSYKIKHIMDNNTAFLLGTPIHKNIGDHLLANAEIEFLKHQCGYDDVIEIPTRYLLNNISTLKSILPIDVPLYITGGGWMGNTWPEDQKNLEIILEAFKSHIIVIMPQTVYYDDNISEIDIKKTKRIYSSVKKLLIFCRDENSYNSVLKYFESETIKTSLRPDMALYIKQSSNHHEKSKQFVCCLRDDREKASNNQLLDFISDYSCKYNIRLVAKSTIANSTTPIWRRKRRILDIIKCFSESDLVITDRLHGMIFSYLASTPCIAIDNRTHKVQGVYEAWLKNQKAICLINNNTDRDSLFKRIETQLKCQYISYDNNTLSEEFAAMANEIRDFIGRNV